MKLSEPLIDRLLQQRFIRRELRAIDDLLFQAQRISDAIATPGGFAVSEFARRHMWECIKRADHIRLVSLPKIVRFYLQYESVPR